MHWLSFPHPHCQVCGLPWFSETAPHLWRFPERMKTELPVGADFTDGSVDVQTIWVLRGWRPEWVLGWQRSSDSEDAKRISR